MSITRLDTVRALAFANQFLDSPNPSYRTAARELLKDLESRLLTDLIEAGLTVETLIEDAPTCNS